MITEVGQPATAYAPTTELASAKNNPQAFTFQAMTNPLIIADASSGAEKPVVPQSSDATGAQSAEAPKNEVSNSNVSSTLMTQEGQALQKSEQVMQVRAAAVESAESGLAKAQSGLAAGTHRQVDVDQAHLHLVNAQIKQQLASIGNNTAQLNLQRVSGEGTLADTPEGAKVLVVADADFRQAVYQNQIIPLAGQAEGLANRILTQSQEDLSDKRVLASVGPLNVMHAEKAVTAAQLVRAEAEAGISDAGTQRQQVHAGGVLQRMSGSESVATPGSEAKASSPSVGEARTALDAADQNVATLTEVVAHAKAARDDANNFQRIFHSAEVITPGSAGKADATANTDKAEATDKKATAATDDGSNKSEVGSLMRANRANVAYYGAQIQFYEALVTQKNAQIDLQMVTETQQGKSTLTPEKAEQAKAQFKAEVAQQAIIPLIKEGLTFSATVLDQADSRDGLKWQLSNIEVPSNLDVSKVDPKDIKETLLRNSSIGLTELTDAKEMLTNLKLLLK